jgi:hypothetical protein
MHLDQAMSIPVDGDSVASWSDRVVELVEEKSRQRQLRSHSVRDEDAVTFGREAPRCEKDSSKRDLRAHIPLLPKAQPIYESEISSLIRVRRLYA